MDAAPILIPLALMVLTLVVMVLVALGHLAWIYLTNFRDLLSFDRWYEVFATIGRNKLRTMLTMMSVGWGIFVLVFLLGLGRGLDQGMRRSFAREASNGLFIVARKTSVAFGGYDVGRQLSWDERDYEFAKHVPGVQHASAEHFIQTSGDSLTRRGTKAQPFEIEAVYPGRLYLELHDMAAGRFINEGDMAQKRKSAVMGQTAADFLFEPDENPIGEWITVAGVPYQVVGIFTHPTSKESERRIYIPATTAQLSYNGADRLGKLELQLATADPATSKAIASTIVAKLAQRHEFDPADRQAIRVRDNVEGASRFRMLFAMISMFVTLIGLGTLAAGVVGVSNIMMIAVKERTKEIGVRKALGATPGSIIAMIVQEAVVLTGIAGLLGLAGGVGALSLVAGLGVEEIYNPSIDIGVGIGAAVFLVVAGALAGYVPARAAARVNPITSLRDG